MFTELHGNRTIEAQICFREDPVQEVTTATVTLHSRNTQCSNGSEITHR